MPKTFSPNQAQFTYDFGIMIAQSTVNKVARLTGVTLTLASAFYALQTTADKYVNTLRENSLRFGGYLSTIQQMEKAQERIVKGQTSFSVEDQLKGLNQIAAAGLNVRKEFDFINKAAHATGQSFTKFSGAIAGAIQGNMQSLVDMGLMTQRSTRMFDKFAANTVMRQQAILNFVKQHRGLNSLIQNDFENIQDQMVRIKETWSSFLRSIIGKPNDPESLYGMVNKSLKSIAQAFSRNYESLRQYGKGIGIVMGWVVRQVGRTIEWLGKQFKKAVNFILGSSETFVERMRVLVVWLEFWRLRVRDFFNDYGSQIKSIIKWLLIFKGLKSVFVISKAAIASAVSYNAALFGRFGFFTRLKRIQRGVGTSWWKALWLAIIPRWVRKSLVWVIQFFNFTLPKAATKFGGILKNIGKFISGSFVGDIGLVIGKFVAVVGLVTTVWTILTKIDEKISGITGQTKRANDAIMNMGISLKNWFYSIYDSVKYHWNTFASWWGTNVADPIKKRWADAGWNDWFANLKKGFKDWIDSITKWLDPILKPFRQLMAFLDKRREMGDKLKVQKLVDRRNFENQSALINIQEVNKKRQTAIERGYDPNRYQYSVRAQELIEQGKQINANNAKKAQNGVTPLVDNKNFAAAMRAQYQKNTPAAQGKENPILTTKKENTTPQVMGAGEVFNENEYSSPITLENGAVQIIVQKGEAIDERKLASRVKQIISDLQREARMRGGQ